MKLCNLILDLVVEDYCQDGFSLEGPSQIYKAGKKGMFLNSC